MATISSTTRSIVSSPQADPAAAGANSLLAAAIGTAPLAALGAPAYTLIQLNNNANAYTHDADGSVRIEGLGGNDTITVALAGTGNDYLDGGTGRDTLNAANTDDFLDGGADIDTLNGNGGNDILRGGAGADIINGGAGIDTVDYATSGAGVTLTLASDPSRTARGLGGDASSDTVGTVENITGSAFVDRLTGNSLDNQLTGNAGDDVLRGMDGDDLLIGDGITDVDLNGVPDDENSDGIPDGVNEAADGGADFLDGGFGNDQLFGGGGDDTLNGGFGDDRLFGGNGADMLNSSDGDDFLDGGNGDDWLIGSLGDDTLIGGAGDDNLNASIGDDTLSGGEGDDELQAGDGVDALDGGTGADRLFAGGGNDTLLGGDGNDRLDGSDGDDAIDGGAGDDSLKGGLGADVMAGGAGVDTLDYSGGGAVGIDLGLGTVSGAALGDTFNGIENVTGSAQNDIIVGDSGNNTLIGGAGADVLIGQGGFDTIDYSASAAAVTVSLNTTVADPLATGTGTGGDAEGDQIQLVERIIGSAFADTLTGGELNDTLVGGAGADVIAGGAGTDTAEYSTSQAGVSIALDAAGAALGAGGDAEGDALSGIENIIGSDLADTLTGNDQTNRLEGRGGDDVLRGGANVGTEFLIGGAGVDTADYSTSAAAVVARLSDSETGGFTSTGGDAQDDVLVTVENIVGSAFNDQLFGATAANRLDGGAGNDLLSGAGGADALIGGTGFDTAFYATSSGGVSITLDNLGSATGIGGDAQGDQLSTIENLIGSAFADILNGNDSLNRLEGGAGNDVFRSGAGGSAASSIAEFVVGGDGVDTIDYSASSSAVLARLFSGTTGLALSQGGHADGDALAQMENVIGSAFNDLLNGTELVNSLDGGAGNDTLAGFDGADTLIGGAGADTADYSASTAGIQVQLSATAATAGIGGHAQGDQLSGIESLTGSAFNDILLGSTAANKLISGVGNDQMRGGSGADILSITGSGAKTVFGDGLGDGGTAGADTFRVLGGTNNVIADYQAGEDIFLKSSAGAVSVALTSISIGGVATWAGRFTSTAVGMEHLSFVALGAQAALTQAQATGLLNTLVTNDLFIDPNLVA